MADVMNVLRDRQFVLGETLKLATHELACRRNERSRKRLSLGRAWQLTARLAHVIWIMYSLAADPSAAVLNFLRRAGGKRRWPNVSDESLLEIAERSFLDADQSHVLALSNVERPADAQALRAAKRLLAEMRIFQWCEALNLQKGAAPSTVSLLHRAQQDYDALPAAIFALTSTGRPAVTARVWAQRWRTRWGARVGTLRVSETLSIDEMRHKVLLLSIRRCALCFHFALHFPFCWLNVAPILSPENGLGVCNFKWSIERMALISVPPGGLKSTPTFDHLVIVLRDLKYVSKYVS